MLVSIGAEEWPFLLAFVVFLSLHDFIHVLVVCVILILVDYYSNL